VVEIFLPPLRERLGDVKLLANEFLARYAQQNGKQVTGFDNDAWSWILNYRWPGNVRELKNAVERAVIMARGAVITVDDITPRHLRPGADTGEHPAVTPPRRRASDRVGAGENGASMVLGMTRDELFEAFSRFLNARSDVARASTPPVVDVTGVVGAGPRCRGGGYRRRRTRSAGEGAFEGEAEETALAVSPVALAGAHDPMPRRAA